MVLGLSVLASFLWCIVYNVLSPTLPDYFVAIVTMGTADFWLLCILTAFVSMLPRSVVFITWPFAMFSSCGILSTYRQLQFVKWPIYQRFKAMKTGPNFG